MELKKFFSHRKKVSKILGYSLVAFVFVIVAIGMIYKFAKKPFYFFNTRGDVVLTDSMSVKNEEHKDFLKNTKQIQAFDFVVSNRITDKTKLKVYDVVIFDNPRIGIDMHRIVEIDYVGDTFELNNLKQEKVGTVDTFKFDSPSSAVTLKGTFAYSDVEIIAYTKDAYDENEYYFNIANASVTPTVTSSLDSNGYYKNVITYHRTSTSPTNFSITKKSYDFNAYFESIRLFGGHNKVAITAESVKNAVDGEFMFNISERYLIRGDKAKTDDGWYERRQLQAKVTNVFPKLGLTIRFLSSPYGTIMVIGLMFIPIAYWMFFKKKIKEGRENEKE